MPDARLAVQSAIKRATLDAQQQMDQLDADSLQELQKIYEQAAADLRARIASSGGADGNISLAQLQDVLQQVQARLDALSSARDELLSGGLQQAASLGVRPLATAGDALGTISSMRVADEALRFVRTFVAADGLQLSDRIWRLDRHAREAVTSAIESAVIQGHGATQAAREFLMRGESVPADIADKMNAAHAGGIGNSVSDVLTGSGSPMDNAMRLFRTELNRAHGEAYIKGVLEHPDAAGVRFKLSPAHPKPDICDLHARANLYGLGPGVYPSRETCPWPAHPNTLSYVEVVFKDEITASDRSGKETSLEALARLPPEQRQGIGRLNKTMPRGDTMRSMEPLPQRAPWNGFPDVLIQADESAVKQSAFYDAAKSGDIESARRLVLATYSQDAIGTMRRMIGNVRPTVVGVSAIEEAGENVIPTALSGLIARRLDLPLDDAIVQINKVSHTGAAGDYRLATPPLFDGTVKAGSSYLLVDDFVGQGGTLANLRGFIENNGGRALLATTLTGKPYSARLALSDETLKMLLEKHGSELENWWKKRFGYGFDSLTESEARYLARIPDADQVRNRILAAAQEGK